jgi:GDPmannose 4,6-dehydratase
MKTQIRLWTLGDLENMVIPSKDALNKVRAILANLKPGEVNDIVWGPDLKCTVIETDTEDVKDEVKPDTKTAMIFGCGGQDGFYLSRLLLSKGYKVIGVVRRSSQARDYLNVLVREGLELVEGDVTDYSCIENLVKQYNPSYIYNLAAQSHVATSFKQPLYTWDVTAKGVINILEVIRNTSPKTRFYQASSSEMFGKNFSVMTKQKDGVLGYCSAKAWEEIKYQDESTSFVPQSPYSIAKLAGHEAVRLYRESYGLFACSGILFNHESEYRGTQFVTRKVTKYVGKLKMHLDACEAEYDAELIDKFPKLKLGNLDAYRDWSHAEDLVKAMVLMLTADKPDDYVVGSGETHSVREFVELAFKEIGQNWKDWVEIDQSLIRPAEVDYLCSKPTKAKEKLGWEPSNSFECLVKRMVNHDIELAKKESLNG